MGLIDYLGEKLSVRETEETIMNFLGIISLAGAIYCGYAANKYYVDKKTHEYTTQVRRENPNISEEEERSYIAARQKKDGLKRLGIVSASGLGGFLVPITIVCSALAGLQKSYERKVKREEFLSSCEHMTANNPLYQLLSEKYRIEDEIRKKLKDFYEIRDSQR